MNGMVADIKKLRDRTDRIQIERKICSYPFDFSDQSYQDSFQEGEDQIHYEIVSNSRSSSRS